ncbi:acetylcholinesterase isoform X1 [Malaya genurostris]|uniref:acetylcholinesterase isoform X1 n=1 Tax=Malaya genurostris TaxID=325434 RepID=UPI0026F3844E|nr:acetylcholinesterase isoform X1 [Malaya genurostris]XP_058446590.1 acetylcholinesterase isoform X1 [Malaya genurostris]
MAVGSNERRLVLVKIAPGTSYRSVRRKCAYLSFGSSLLICAAFLLCYSTYGVGGQYHTTRDPRWYSREGDYSYHLPNPGDPDYRSLIGTSYGTYTYNNRRYGYYQPNGYGQLYPGQNLPGQYPQNTGLGEDRFKFDPTNPNNVQTPFPGVLGGWREDLQGKLRRDSLQLDRDVFVTTNYGQVQGFKVHLYDNPDPKSFYRPWHSPVDRIMGTCSTFLGIPYALPPTFEGRFKPPRQHRGWQLLQAVDYGPACPQPVQYTGATKGIRDMDEDCLYLNVFSPNTQSGVAQKYPVMVYIHGGEFVRGASNTFPGHMLAAFYEVVVVTFNYRLGALGFLSTGDENSPGNYGILDQIMAVRWVYDNIESFNGDRDSITLFGPGAGAASAGLLMVAPQTKDIVTRVIAQSGSAVADWALIVDKYRAQNTSRVFGQMVGCSIETSWKLVNCMRQGRSFYELGNAEFAPHVGLFPWGPVLDINFTYPGDEWYEGWRERDWHFLSETPEELIRKGHFNRGLHYMSGVTQQEAAFVITQNETLAPYYEIDEKFFKQKVWELVYRYNYTLNLNGTYEAVKYMYTHWPDPKNTTFIREQYINLLSDFLYRAPADKMIKLLVERKVPVYSYVTNTTIEGLKLAYWRKVPHDIEHYLLTGAPFMDVEFFPRKARLDRLMWTDNDRNMSHFFMKTYSDFARYGNPTPQRVLGLHFEKATNGDLRYLNLNTTYNSSILMNYRQTESAFWTQYIPAVVGVLVPTYPPSTEFWWEPKEPLQIAFWSMSVACMLLIVIVVICCILWRNAKRQSDRFYDEGVFVVDNPESEREIGIDNNVIQAQPLRTRDNIYEYRDSPSKYGKQPHPDAASFRSPSSLGMTQTTGKSISGSQSSLRSGISLKESTTVSPTPRSESNFDRNIKYAERGVDTEIHKNGKYPRSDSKTTLNDTKSREFATSTPVENVSRSQQPTPQPAGRGSRAGFDRSNNASRTNLIEGIPQTEV